ncbi:hypothetical protein Tco_0936696 [Tanacetum coccineum]|uniref:Uncharacterized protein n=1 Tax=Tanacetum coccineum TaxID=301880 RepID=A0ABQ5DC89_9ASTR
MCKAYGGEPSLDLLWVFLNLGPTGNWLTLSNRGGAGIPKALTKPVTHIKGWKGSFFFIENKIVPSKYPKLLLEENKLGKKSFKDVVPLHVQEDPLYNQIATYPCNVQTFPDPILFLAGLKSFWEHSPKKPIIYHCRKEMDFRSFMVGGIDGEFHFESKGGFADDEGNSPSTGLLTNEAPVIDVAPLNSAPPSHVAENVKDSDDLSSGGDIVGEAERLRKSSKVTVVGDASDPLDVDSDPGIHGKFYTFSASSVLSTCGAKLIFVFPEFPSDKGLKDSTDCHFVVAHVTPPSWKQHLRDISLEKLCDIHDKAYMRYAVLDNMLNSRTRQLISALEKARASCNAIREKEIEKDKAYAELERKCNEALQDLDKNPLVLDMRVEIETLQGRLMGFTDRATVVSKVLPDVATKLICSDEMEVASLMEPFILEKMPGYRSSSKEGFDRVGDGLANASYPFLAEVSVDPYASVEQLLSKKLQSLCSKPTSSCSKPSSSKAPVM